MKMKFFAGKIAIIAIMSFGATAPVPMQADSNTSRITGSDAGQAVLDNRDDLPGRAEALALRYRVQIVVDPDIPAVHVGAPEQDVSLTSALDSVARQIPNVAWRSINVNKD